MTGSADGWAARRYFAVDGGQGAAWLARLSRLTPRLQPAASPRHADLLIAIEPITRKLVPAVLETVRALPAPRAGLVIGEPTVEQFPEADLVRLEDVLPGIRRVRDAGDIDGVVNAALASRPLDACMKYEHAAAEPVTVAVPPKRERELATEPVVVTLGPLQSLTAGPLRLLLVCDGEQVGSAETEAGYAARQVATAMTRASWSAAADLAGALDPLAPVAGRLAYVTAVERLQGRGIEPVASRARHAALAVERASNALSWLARFAAVLAYDRLADHAAALRAEVEEITAATWERSPESWIVPQSGTGGSSSLSRKRLGELAAAVRDLRRRLAGDRLLRLRTTRVGVITGDRLRKAGVTGPALRASVEGDGDTFSRLVVRVDIAAFDLAKAAELLADRPDGPERFQWSIPAGEATASVEGPRGTLTIRITGDGGETPRAVEWSRPSANLLGILPDVLAGQTLPDAEVIVASLDLAMAEADA